AALAVALALWSLSRWTGAWRSQFDRFGPWSLYRIVVGAGVLSSLVSFMRAGMPVPEAVRRLRAGAGPWLGERLDAALYFLNSGHDLGTALQKAGHGFPDRAIIEDLRVFASLGNLEDALQRIAAEWTRESVERLDAFSATMKVVGMVLVAATVGLIQIGIITVQQQLTAGP
ncbi:MAG TPA: type II secretion system F family protein, partial [Rhodospirillaceae bacterium]|nr:type II secretion system F family protein [Rhodospirillaceae bacterium]